MEHAIHTRVARFEIGWPVDTLALTFDDGSHRGIAFPARSERREIFGPLPGLALFNAVELDKTIRDEYSGQMVLDFES